MQRHCEGGKLVQKAMSGEGKAEYEQLVVVAENRVAGEHSVARSWVICESMSGNELFGSGRGSGLGMRGSKTRLIVSVGDTDGGRKSQEWSRTGEGGFGIVRVMLVV